MNSTLTSQKKSLGKNLIQEVSFIENCLASFS